MSGYRPKMGSFTIQRQLPSLNDYINACRKNRYVGARFKRNVENEIGVYIIKAKMSGQLPPFDTTPCIVDIIWYEKNFKRDVDNIQSGAKYILDALQRFGILKNDSQKCVLQIYHKIERSDTGESYVCVMLKETL